MSSFYRYVGNKINTWGNVCLFLMFSELEEVLSNTPCFLTKNTQKFASKMHFVELFLLPLCIIRAKVILILL